MGSDAICKCYGVGVYVVAELGISQAHYLVCPHPPKVVGNEGDRVVDGRLGNFCAELARHAGDITPTPKVSVGSDAVCICHGVGVYVLGQFGTRKVRYLA